MHTISCNPGATIYLPQQVTDGYGRIDDFVPTIDYVVTPSGGFLSGYPLTMTRLDVGLYRGAVTIPSGLSGIGSYIASISWDSPEGTQYEVFLINAFLPFGTASVSPG